ncbi:winged helix-turn-helix domain-containing tetratricopeptide repeat protein [Dyella japonica]|uniref:OmpR/PhoB-type domain-containing protein n=1 Tax=Dyella japonica A8 TaxID=1217721 RepID=A0A075JV76_9GAMM|nr:winged helix-turn-helix domain-containing protein [Dyella japonica]AIF46006.1 hypothetical protein HY57_01350 [Dyella japonica A8]
MHCRYIAFGAVVIDLVGRRTRVTGEDVALEPKAFDVLVLLAQTPGKAFTRDEILDAVWGHRHVTPSVLNRAVTLIRQALGDSGKVLHTLHGIGYRFDGQVQYCLTREELPGAGPAGGPADQAETPAPSDDEVAPTAVTPLESAPVSIDPELPQPMAEPVVALPETVAAARPAARRGRLLFAVGLVGVIIVLITGYVRHHEGTKAPISPTLVVLPLHVIGDDKNEAAFADGLSEELTTHLARIEGLRLIAGNSAERAQRAGFDAAQLAERLHVTHAIEGSLREAGDQLRIDLRLIEVPSGKTIWAQGYDRKLADVLVVQQDMAQSVASTLSLRMGLAHESTRVPDPQVLREFLTLRHTFLSEADDTAYQKAEVDLNILAARAPDYAPVHGLLALNLASDFEGEGKESEAVQEARQALALDPGDFYAHATLGTIAEKQRDWRTAKKEYDTALMLNPSDVIMRNIMGMWLGRLGYGDLAVAQFQIAYASDPLGYWVTYNLGTQLDAIGHHDQAQKYLDELPRLEHASARLTAAARWSNAVWRHDLAAARELAARMPDETGMGTAYATVTQALLDPSRWPQASAAIAAYEAKTGEPARLRLFEPQGDADALLRHFETGTQRPDGELVWVPEFKALRHAPAFQDFLRRMQFIPFWNVNGWPPQCRPEGEGARCD